MGDIFFLNKTYSSPGLGPGIAPNAGIAPAASKGEVFGSITFLLRMVVSQGMPRTRGPLLGPHIVGWIAQGPTAKQRRRESKQP